MATQVAKVMNNCAGVYSNDIENRNPFGKGLGQLATNDITYDA
jgi:hypothetical protein